MAGRAKIAIICDGRRYFIRRIRISEHDCSRSEKVYRCDLPIGPAFKTLDEAVAFWKSPARYRKPGKR